MTIKSLISQKTLAKLLDLNPKTISRWRAVGKIPQPFIVDSNRPYWTAQQIEIWQLNNGSLDPRPEHSGTLADMK